MIELRYDTLLFDADGTLLDFTKAERESLYGALAAFGITADKNTAIEYSSINDRLWKLLERGGISKSELRVRRFSELAEMYGYEYDAAALADAYFDCLATKSYLLGNALEVCRTLSETCRLYLITNGFKVIQKGRFGGSPLAELFAGCFISEDIGFEKPSVKYFDAVKAGIPNFCAERTLVVGDSVTSDIKGGIAAGLDVCWFDPSGRPAPDDMNINYIISDLRELYDITK